MSRKMFEFNDGEKEVLGDVLEEIFLLNVKFNQTDDEISKLLKRKPVLRETPSNFLILYRCLLFRVEEAKKDLEVLEDMLARLKEERCF